MTKAKRIRSASMLRIFGVLTLATVALQAQAQQTERAGRWEGSMQLKYSNSQDITGSTGSQAKIDGAYGFGFGFAYNFNDHLALGGDFAWSSPDYTATVTPAAGNGNAAYTVSGNMETSSAHLVTTWNLLARALTPFVSAGVGATWVDTNIPAGPPVNVCWYDPWWGYYCGTSVPTRTATYFSYNLGAGLRWDAQQNWYVRGLVAQQWLDVGNGVGTPSTTQFRVDLGMRF